MPWHVDQSLDGILKRKKKTRKVLMESSPALAESECRDAAKEFLDREIRNIPENRKIRVAANQSNEGQAFVYHWTPGIK
jgi:hypothetical protein